MAEQLELESASGIRLRPFYEPPDDGPADGGHRLGRPGEPPFTRGLHATAYNRTPWMMQQVLGAGLAEQTREIMDRLVAEGMEGYFGHPVFNVVFGSKRTRWTSSSATGRCSTPLGTMINSPAETATS